MLVLRERKNSDDYRMEAMFHKYNALCFSNRLVLDFPLEWSSVALKKALGYVKGYVARGKVLSLTMNNRFFLTPDEFLGVFIHEMIHVSMIQQRLDAKHGPLFIREYNRIKAMGYPVSLSDTPATTLATGVVLHQRLVVVVVRPGKKTAFVSPIQIPTLRELLNFVMRLASTYRRDGATIYALASANPLVHEAPRVRNFAQATKHYLDDRALEMVKPGASTIFGEWTVDARGVMTPIVKIKSPNQVIDFFS